MKISLILPYWDRKEAADAALARLDALYGGWLDLEVIIVDDGNRARYKPQPSRLNIRVIDVEEKDEPKSPCTCWNTGATVATGEILAISCIEVLHEKPVLEQLAKAVIAGGPKAYQLAAAWCPDEIGGRWHTHSSVEVPDCPPGTGIAFLGVMHRTLFWEAGGWDEDYRDGAGYEDRDFIRRMARAGAQFTIRDDLVVVHPKIGARIHWRPEMLLRNEALYRAKWTQPVTFVCLLRRSPDFGPEYVNILHDMVVRNLPVGYPGRFVCITDSAEGLAEGIETLPLPADLEKWWGKLWMFKRGLFPDGERMVFMDLDTVIVGDLSKIVEYRGAFATLSDFYQPHRLGPAVMLWEAGGPAARIWEAWEAAGKPRDSWGDLWWINQLDGGEFARRADVLQQAFPGQFCSFKAHCHPVYPKGTRVVCFHGLPRPRDANVDWVQHAWKVGGGTSAELAVIANTVRETVEANVRAACALGLPRLGMEPENDQRVAIVAGGPSLVWTLDELRGLVAEGVQVIAVNGAVHYLAAEGIKTDAQVIIDARAENVRFIDPPLADRYYAASQCAPEVFSALERRIVTLMHMNTPGIREILPAGESTANLISSGSTVGLAALVVAYQLGHRSMHLFGFDSSFADAHHAYEQLANDADNVIEATAHGRTFKTTPWMVQQVNEFQSIAFQLAEVGCEITVAGDGLLPHVARAMCAPQEPSAQLIDLPTNTPAETLIAQSRANLARELPQLCEVEPHHGVALIVGGGPSLKDTLPRLQQARKRGGMIFALNGTHDWLIERGIIPHFHVIADARAHNVKFVRKANRRVHYLVAAQCHPDVFDALAGHEVTVWCAHVDGIEPVLEACGKPVLSLGGGATVGLKAMSIAQVWGFRRLELFGFDSAYRGEANHAYPQPMNDAESVIDVDCLGRKFRCAPWMVQQAQGFEQQVPYLESLGCRIKVHGEGLIPWIANQLKKKEAA